LFVNETAAAQVVPSNTVWMLLPSVVFRGIQCQQSAHISIR